MCGVVWETRWDYNATTVANPSTSPPGPLKAIWAQGHVGSRPSDGGVGGGDGDGGADGDRDE